jgi:hypothetical protein
MSRGGYRHGKRHEPKPPVYAAPRTRYLEDRVATLEAQVDGLRKLCLGLIEHEEEEIRHQLAALELKRQQYQS